MFFSFNCGKGSWKPTSLVLILSGSKNSFTHFSKHDRRTNCITRDQASVATLVRGDSVVSSIKVSLSLNGLYIYAHLMAIRLHGDHFYLFAFLHGRWSRGAGGCSPQFLPNFCKIFLFLCLQPPHVPVSPRTFKFTPSSMSWLCQFFVPVFSSFHSIPHIILAAAAIDDLSQAVKNHLSTAPSFKVNATVAPLVLQ